MDKRHFSEKTAYRGDQLFKDVFLIDKTTTTKEDHANKKTRIQSRYAAPRFFTRATGRSDRDRYTNARRAPDKKEMPATVTLRSSCSRERRTTEVVLNTAETHEARATRPRPHLTGSPQPQPLGLTTETSPLV